MLFLSCYNNCIVLISSATCDKNEMLRHFEKSNDIVIRVAYIFTKRQGILKFDFGILQNRERMQTDNAVCKMTNPTIYRRQIHKGRFV